MFQVRAQEVTFYILMVIFHVDLSIPLDGCVKLIFWLSVDLFGFAR